MRKLVETTFVTLDGVISDTEPSTAPHASPEKWGSPYWDEQHMQYGRDLLFAADALLLGRVTYEGFYDAWPSREGEFADKFNNMPKYVISTTMDEAEWNNSTLLKGDPAEEVTKLKEQQDGDIVVHGSAQLVQSLLENDLVDELRLMVFPVVLGSGKKLFGETSDKKSLELADTRIVGDGVAILTYRRA
jgi:dihydrofolate reductase